MTIVLGIICILSLINMILCLRSLRKRMDELSEKVLHLQGGFTLGDKPRRGR